MSQLVSAFDHDPTIDLVNKVDECAMSYPEDRPIIVGVAGGSGSGKTTIARHLLESLGAEQITYIPHDKYVKIFCAASILLCKYQNIQLYIIIYIFMIALPSCVCVQLLQRFNTFIRTRKKCAQF